MNYLNSEELEMKIGYSFKDKNLFKQALTHSSYTNEQKINKLGDYERIEFLGDAVLEIVSSEFLFHKYPNVPEGKLTKMRASMVCESSLAMCARDLDLGKYIFFGKGEEGCGGRTRESILADVMEAIIGAIYLDAGFEQAKAHIMKFVLVDLEDKVLFSDSKSALQEVVQAMEDSILEYVITGENGPEHCKTFSVDVLINGKVVGSGEGKNKKAAEQSAAYQALLKLKDR